MTMIRKIVKGVLVSQTGASKWTLLLLLYLAVCQSGFCQAQSDLGHSPVGDRVFQEGVAGQTVLNLTGFMSAHHIQGRELVTTYTCTSAPSGYCPQNLYTGCCSTSGSTCLGIVLKKSCNLGGVPCPDSLPVFSCCTSFSQYYFCPAGSSGPLCQAPGPGSSSTYYSTCSSPSPYGACCQPDTSTCTVGPYANVVGTCSCPSSSPIGSCCNDYLVDTVSSCATPTTPAITPTPPAATPAPPIRPPASAPPPPVIVYAGSSGSKVGIIVGCVAGAAVVTTAIIGIVLCCLFKNQRRKKERSNDLPTHEAPKEAAVPHHPAAPTKQAGGSSTSFASSARDSKSRIYPYEEVLSATNGFSMSNLVGQGGFSKVYKGTQVDGTSMAVKVLQSDPVNGPNNESFYTEMAIMSSLRHKYLVSMLGYAIAGTERIIVLEFCKGGNLFQALHGPERFDWSKRLRTALYVTIGLEYLHDGIEPPIMHRDIKSANVLFADVDRLTAKLSDFGVAKFEDGAMSARTRVLGTRGYIALEYLQSGQVSRYTDIYSLGVLLSELVTGRPCTFQMGNDSVTLRNWVVENKHQPLALVDPALGNDFHPQQAIGIIQLAVECMNQHEPTARPLAAQVHQRIEQLISITRLQPPSAEKVFFPTSGRHVNTDPPVAQGPAATTSLTGSADSYDAPPTTGGSSAVGTMSGYQRGGPEPPKNLTVMQNFTNIHTGR
ncbi:Putative protein kinase superfamily protein [Klebsormidium nitens]|uniref:Protein kinase domain-containing protein n=1 Tax=Klebsormidium nitens TaxID=105231 RepID=A0A1Y1IN92_KLENI|nr:Putative protein kinase superfamily protein [Klebsormidium nitens]|eukprot:GAQ90077.1 Putative protein kinase superfamily protein [Klebsormidium nitens]